MKSFTKEGVDKAKSALASYFFKFGRQPSTPSQLVHFNKNSLGLGKLRFDIRLSVAVVCCCCLLLFVDVVVVVVVGVGVVTVIDCATPRGKPFFNNTRLSIPHHFPPMYKIHISL